MQRGIAMKRWAFGYWQPLIRLCLRKPVMLGLEKIDLTRPSIFVANHLGAFGPVVLNVFFPFRLIPWVTHDVTDPILCPIHLSEVFVEPELRLKPPLSRWLSLLIGKICVWLMRRIGAIPVYRKSRKIIVTVEKSLVELAAGRNLLIFPEVENMQDRMNFTELNKGFINIAKRFYEREGKTVDFYPICIDKKRKRITVGDVITYNPQTPFRREKDRIARYLKENILQQLSGPAQISQAETSEGDEFADQGVAARPSTPSRLPSLKG